MSYLPQETWGKVCGYLDTAESVASLACCCQTTRRAAEIESEIWRRVLHKDFKSSGLSTSGSTSGLDTPPCRQEATRLKRSKDKTRERDWRGCYFSWATGKPAKENLYRNAHCFSAPKAKRAESGARVNALVLDGFEGREGSTSVSSCWSCGGDGLAHQWDLITGITVTSIEGSQNNVSLECADTCGRNQLVVGCGKQISLWDARQKGGGKALISESIWNTNLSHYDEILSVACAKSAPLIVSGGADDCVRVWDMRYMEEALLELDTLHGGSVYCIAIDNDKNCVYTGAGDKTICLWDLQTGHWFAQAHGHTGDVYDIAAGSKRALSAAADGTIREWRVEEKEKDFVELVNVNTLGLTADMEGEECVLAVKALGGGPSAFRGITECMCLEILGEREDKFLGGTWSGDVILGDLATGGKAFSRPVTKRAEDDGADNYNCRYSPVTAIAATDCVVVSGFNNGAVRFSQMCVES